MSTLKRKTKMTVLKMMVATVVAVILTEDLSKASTRPTPIVGKARVTVTVPQKKQTAVPTQKAKKVAINVAKKAPTVAIAKANTVAKVTTKTPVAKPVVTKTDKTGELIKALTKVESSGKGNAIGDRRMKDKAYGLLQVRKPCIDDINRYFHCHLRPQDLLGNQALSEWVCRKYLEIYATKSRLKKEPTQQDMARIWNGGPDGWREQETKVYWAKVNRQLWKMECARVKASNPNSGALVACN